MIQYHILENHMRGALTEEEQTSFRQMAMKIEQYKRNEIQKTIVRLSNKNHGPDNSSFISIMSQIENKKPKN